MYERIRNLREDKDLKQEDLAKLLNCTQACYSHYESGKREPSFEKLVRIADYLDVSLDYLLCRDDFYEKHFRP
jgi:transcriptional regulator with XRE-family HTH domain